MPSDLGSSAIYGGFGLVGAGVSAAANMRIAKYNNEQAKMREQLARKENYIYGEMSANNADFRTRNLYDDLYSPGAQLEQLKSAELSPSLFYGDGGGISGQAGAQGTGASGVNPQVFGMSPIDLSQIGLIAAQTAKVKEETKTIQSKRDPEISKILADAGFANAAAATSKAQAEGVKLDNMLKDATLDASIYQICEQAEKAGNDALKSYYEMQNTKLITKMNEELYDTNIKLANGELELLCSKIKVNERNAEKLRNDVLKSFDEIAQEWKKVDLLEQQTESYTEWLEKRIPQIEKELEIKLQGLGVEKTRLVTECVRDVIKSVLTVAVLKSSFKGGQGSNQTPPMPKPDRGRGGNALNNGPHVYETDNLWDY